MKRDKKDDVNSIKWGRSVKRIKWNPR